MGSADCTGRVGLGRELQENLTVEDVEGRELDDGWKRGHFVIDLYVVRRRGIFHRLARVADGRLGPAPEDSVRPGGDELPLPVADGAIADDSDGPRHAPGQARFLAGRDREDRPIWRRQLEAAGLKTSSTLPTLAVGIFPITSGGLFQCRSEAIIACLLTNESLRPTGRNG